MAKINIYSPTYWREEKTKIAVSSIIESVKKSKHDVKYYICDNNSPQSLKNWLNDQVDNDRINAFFCDENWGKAKIVNYVHRNKSRQDTEYIVSIDSDMRDIHNQEYNWIDEMVNILQQEEKIGVLSTFQDGANCHHLHALPNRVNMEIDGTKHSVRYGHFGGVAGGCIMLRTKDFDFVDGYREHDVYNADDALLMRKTHEVMKKVCCVSETVALEHMANYPDEKEYQQWKIDKCQGKIQNGVGTKGFFDE